MLGLRWDQKYFSKHSRSSIPGGANLAPPPVQVGLSYTGLADAQFLLCKYYRVLLTRHVDICDFTVVLGFGALNSTSETALMLLF